MITEVDLPDLQSLPYRDLRLIQTRVEELVRQKAKTERTHSLQTIVQLIQEFEFTSEELNQALVPVTKTAAKPVPHRKAKRVEVKRVPKKIEPRYRNPENPEQTWTGRGLAPLWIRDVADRSQFLINPT